MIINTNRKVQFLVTMSGHPCSYDIPFSTYRKFRYLALCGAKNQQTSFSGISDVRRGIHYM